MFIPPLSRSPSRISSLRRCERKFFFTYYWRNLPWTELESKQRDILFLKILQTIPNRSWNLIHSIISHYLHEKEKNPDITIEQYKEMYFEKIIENKIKQPYYNSLQRDYSKWYQEWDKKKASEGELIGLIEHFHKEIKDSEHEVVINNIIDKITHSIDNIIETPVYQSISDKTDNKKIYIEPMKTDFEEMKFKSDNIPWTDLFVQPDFWMKDEKNTYVIIDRKTGKNNNWEDEITDQLLAQAYRIYTQEKLTDDAIIEWYLCNLDTWWELSWWRISINEVKEYENKIKDNIETLKDLLIDRDPQKNEPIWIEKFHKTDDVNKCKFCAFRSICNRNA